MFDEEFDFRSKATNSGAQGPKMTKNSGLANSGLKIDFAISRLRFPNPDLRVRFWVGFFAQILTLRLEFVWGIEFQDSGVQGAKLKETT